MYCSTSVDPLVKDMELTNFDSIVKLLRGRTCEQRVAGLLISSKMFDKLKDSLTESQVESLLHNIVSAVTVKFILRMLTTQVDATEGQMKSTAKHIMRVAAGYPRIAVEFVKHAPTIVNALIVQEPVFKNDDMDIIFAILQMDPSMGKLASDAALGRLSRQSSKITPDDLQNIIKFLVSLSVSFDEANTLSADTAAAMRSVIIQGLHGAADIRTRECTYNALVYLFQNVHPSWTVEPSGKNEKPGSFASFVSLIVCGDLKIFFEENLSVFFAACSGGVLPAEAVAVRYQHRVAACFSILDSVLRFLIGDATEADEDIESAWGGLPASSLLSMQKAVHTVLNDLMEFVKEAHSMITTYADFSTEKSGMECKNTFMSYVIERALMSIVQWALEDPELLQLLASNISDILFFSTVAKTTSPSVPTSDFSILKLCSVSGSGSGQPGKGSSAIDILQSMLPVLLEIASESPLLESNRETGSETALWDDDSINMLNSDELLARLLVVITETSWLFLDAGQFSCDYDEIFSTALMAAELVSVLSVICMTVKFQYSLDTMAISRLSAEWSVMASAVRKLPSTCPQHCKSRLARSNYGDLVNLFRSIIDRKTAMLK